MPASPTRQPLVLSTWSFGPIANSPAMDSLNAGNAALDAVVAAATAVENDPAINSVGVGGLPDADGQVSLDGCVMTNPDRCGSVCYIRNYANPVAIARAVMERTIHIMLAGDGAEAFAAREGFVRQQLLTDAARTEWEQWRSDPKRLDREKYKGWIPPLNVEEIKDGVSARSTGGLHPEPSHDTVSILALDRSGQLAGACSTSGMAFKVPGRVGDSPIIGHGLYVDQQAGAAAATGTGEIVMGSCGSFLAVEHMRNGMAPLEAIVQVLTRITQRFKLSPDHQVAMIAMAPDGTWASAALKHGFHHTITDAHGTRIEPAQRVLGA
ncbi:MAG: isoaspartyl peptidase/L-asparaginase [Pyrinomonadaceae bacterium]|nr:isoaspartyl peptidase/L-asparaginase [Phycisphaerales bacterium]